MNSNKNFKQNNIKKSNHRPKTFVLRGNLLTVNLSNTTKKIRVDRYTRAVMYNNDAYDTSGHKKRYHIDIKQGSRTIQGILYNKKYERNNDFQYLQRLLSSV